MAVFIRCSSISAAARTTSQIGAIAPRVSSELLLSPTTSFSYPSGHAVFFTRMSFMTAVSIAPKIRPAFRPIL